MTKWALLCALAVSLGILLARATHEGAVSALGLAPGGMLGKPLPASLAGLRGPYHLAFVASFRNGHVEIAPSSIRLVGSNGKESADVRFDKSVSPQPQVTLMIAGKQISLEPMRFA